MPVPIYGRVTPLQMDMLNLGGEVLIWDEPGPPTEFYRLHLMKFARKMLRQHTGRDFGYDLAAWHHFLLNDEAFSEDYTFDYAWDAVKPRIIELLDDPYRMRLVWLAERLFKEPRMDSEAPPS